MYLINANSLTLKYFDSSDIPKYAILSHTWGQDEMTFEDINAPPQEHVHKRGELKVKNTCAQALKDGLGWAWVDTCCIDKKSSAELSEAINSMYRYYQEATVCYAYLADVDADAAQHFERSRHSRWYTRGWTLQELIAPIAVRFFSSEWVELGERGDLAPLLEKITRIPSEVLQGISPKMYSIAVRFSWASRRETTRLEDEAYCLMGLLDVNMPLLYGEGRKAFTRLQRDHQEFARPKHTDMAVSREPIRSCVVYGWCLGRLTCLVPALLQCACNADRAYSFYHDELGLEYSILHTEDPATHRFHLLCFTPGGRHKCAGSCKAISHLPEAFVRGPVCARTITTIYVH